MGFTKDGLIEEFRKYLGYEEELESNLSKFYLALDWRKVIDVKHHGEIESGLNVMLSDTKKHEALIAQMADYLERSDQNDF